MLNTAFRLQFWVINPLRWTRHALSCSHCQKINRVRKAICSLRGFIPINILSNYASRKKSTIGFWLSVSWRPPSLLIISHCVPALTSSDACVGHGTELFSLQRAGGEHRAHRSSPRFDSPADIPSPQGQGPPRNKIKYTCII